MITIEQNIMPAGRPNRPGTKRVVKGITVHDTDNTGKGSDARAHAKYLAINPEAVARKVSWHYTVDDQRAVQSLPDDEVGWHASSAAGNRDTIGVEICVNVDGDQAKADANAAELVAMLLKRHGLGIATVVQHHHWNGKNCPRHLREKIGGWDGFLAAVKAAMGAPAAPAAPAKDPNEPADWAAEAWAWVQGQGFMDGTRPGDPLTRQELAVTLWRVGKLNSG